MKILILKPSSLGDVVQALPVLRLLKKAFPQSQIYWWISSDLAPLLEHDPDLTGIFIFYRRRWAHPRTWGHLARTLRMMRMHKFDWVIDLQGLARSALMAWMANGQFMIGVDDPREGARLFYDRSVPRPSYETHAVDWYLEVVKALGVPVHRDFDWIPPRPRLIEQLKRRWRISTGPKIMLNPGARWNNKRWPARHFAELARLVAADHADAQFVVFGGHAEAEAGQQIQASLPPGQSCLDLTGRTTLPELVEWIRMGSVMITNDTGPMHIAAALGKPVVGIFGPTQPLRTGPYAQSDHALRIPLPCAPCMKASCGNPILNQCMEELTPLLVKRELDRHIRAETLASGR